MNETNPTRLEAVVLQLYGEQINAYSRNSDDMRKHAINVCLPAVVSLSLPEQYASLVLTSRMDNELQKMLERTLHRQGHAGELLFDYGCPFGTFSAKINAAYSFGFLTKKMYDALTCCRKIRNAYAHADNPDEAVESKDYTRPRDKLLNLDVEYVAECVIKLHTLRDKCNGIVLHLPEFSKVTSVMLQVCEMLGMVAFHGHSSRSQLLRFPCGYFGPTDSPGLEAFSRMS